MSQEKGGRGGICKPGVEGKTSLLLFSSDRRGSTFNIHQTETWLLVTAGRLAHVHGSKVKGELKDTLALWLGTPL